ncbi:PREDICTED: dehydrogenase/reductase SDR family member 11-like [Dinoponera quadriceps]|uniref:Dehydrogenase/reductase SDR family member 11-like n=1 Tax=Dinoponera quadriceps TaxID=609295 RepID=A0A6P3XFC2_DINQU|nr:PREDICTED: dehydrogenase/reductase SDR family member 11-like [Dinoponera quadriceps]
MNRWIGKVAVVTGASSGIGEAIATTLVEHGLKVVGLARRIDKLREIAERLATAKGSFHPIQCDVVKEEEILKAFEYANSLGGVDILINNAAVIYPETIIDGTTEKYHSILDINVAAVAICTREATKSMRERNVEGHIININSTAGHNASIAKAPLSLYHTSKYAITGMTEVIRNELTAVKAPIKVTSLSPGLVKTDLPANLAPLDTIFKIAPHLLSQDIADAVVYLLGTPPHVQVTELSIIGSALEED